MTENKLLIIGHGGHGKDTVAEMFKRFRPNITFSSSSLAAAKIFIYEALKEKYSYTSFEECFADRHNRRKEWHDLIVDFNKEDRAKLAKEILKNNDIYVGMRSDEELRECMKQDIFRLIIGVFDPRKPLESSESFNIDFWNVCDLIIPNAGTLEELELKVSNINYMLTKSGLL